MRSVLMRPIPIFPNMIRNKPGSFDLAMRAVEATKSRHLMLQINTTAMEYRMLHLPG